jgi:histidine phosphotransfer protein HptB
MTTQAPLSAPPSAEPRLDPLALARLQELDPDGRHGVVNRVLTAFDTSLTRMLGQLEAQIEAPTPTLVASVAHTLKSSSASVGALELARSCAEVEARIRAGDTGSLQRDIGRLISDGQAALVAVGAILRP